MSNLRDKFTETVTEVGLSDDKLIVLVSDISHFRFKPLFDVRPKQYYNVGICENTVINMASGLSSLGFHVVVHTFSSFLLERSYEQIKLGFGYQRLGCNILAIGCGIDYPSHGVTHHTYGDFALMKTIDGSQIFFPVSELEFNQLFKKTYNNGKLNIFRIPQYNHDYSFKSEQINPGKGILIKEGSDVTIVVLGQPLKTVLSSIYELEKNNVSAEIVYINTVKPLDMELINKSINKTRRCLVIEEHGMYGGVFDDILRFTKDLNEIKYSSINLGDQYIHEYGTYEQHHKRLGFSVEGIIKKVSGMM